MQVLASGGPDASCALQTVKFALLSAGMQPDEACCPGAEGKVKPCFLG